MQFAQQLTQTLTGSPLAEAADTGLLLGGMEEGLSRGDDVGLYSADMLHLIITQLECVYLN